MHLIIRHLLVIKIVINEKNLRKEEYFIVDVIRFGRVQVSLI
jgi:hypothetical protein